ncbi:hypothetical protein [Pedobacter sp.]|jgi:hypothetical protein|uniref:hypothetical protein n=1 Tax=Pedobacter sp. TaxID=1411316 RepID=UPI002B92E009|nr:hypothetical protein [Pedobacter sp.]HWW42364.1 hypothetical protein [Pedobacter sp.]
MNYKSLAVIMLLSSAFIYRSNAQEKVKKFCTISYGGNYDLWRNPRIDYGQTKRYTPLKDSVFIQKLNKVEAIENFVQALNYMTGLGWKYEGNIPLADPSRPEFRILFSRDFDPAELTEGKS